MKLALSRVRWMGNISYQVKLISGEGRPDA